ncbi:DUF192 domain-containing protein [Shewanella algicola]|uniref:DUF192 domain-containing protein n=1 Tax=Shewanella algicola TaxID=640633 RepID=UPI0024944573|nr:DUF192 domain-containing protein [Shewanella algicola]
MELINIKSNKGSCIDNVIYANKTVSRLKGLLGQRSLTMQQGLLIAPCNSVHTFGMKFDIDVVFLDKNNKVVKIKTSVKPARMTSCFGSKKVLELASGSAEYNNISIGDSLSW